MGRIIPYIMENKKCLKPPTSYLMGAYDHQGCEHHFRSLLWDDPSRSVIENMIRWISTIEIVLATKD